MRLARSAVSGGLVVAAMSVVGAPALALSTASSAAAADAISVWPARAHAGERISLSVANCSVGSVRHFAASKAFTKDVTLDGKADTGNAATRLRRNLAPGTYGITAHCGGSHVAKGSVIVVAGATRPGVPSKSHGIAVYNQPKPTHTPAAPYTTISARPAAAHNSTSSSTPYWAAGAGVVVLAAAGGAFLIRRRSS